MSTFNKNELKILRFFVDDYGEFTFYQKDKNHFFKVPKTLEQMKQYTKMTILSQDNMYIVYNLTFDNNLQINFPKACVSGEKTDRTFEIIQPFLSSDKQLHKILLLIKEKKFFKSLDSMKRTEAISLSANSKSIFPKMEKVEESKQENNEEAMETHIDKNNSENIKNIKIYYNAVDEIEQLLKLQLGNLSNLFANSVFKKISKQMMKTLVTEIIQITLNVISSEKSENVNINDDISEYINKVKEEGLFCPKKIGKINGYLLYIRENRDKVKKEMNTNSLVEINRVMSKKWKELSIDDRENYKTRSKKH